MTSVSNAGECEKPIRLIACVALLTLFANEGIYPTIGRAPCLSLLRSYNLQSCNCVECLWTESQKATEQVFGILLWDAFRFESTQLGNTK
jgi:hypothetical protein